MSCCSDVSIGGTHTPRSNPMIERRCGQAPTNSTPVGASSSTQTAQTSHEELLTRLKSALKALGGRPNATPPTSSNRFVADELEACSRRVEAVPRMQSLDTADHRVGGRQGTDDLESSVALNSISTSEMGSRYQGKHRVLSRECGELEAQVESLRREVERLATERASLFAEKEALATRRGELTKIEGHIHQQQQLLRDVTAELEQKQRRAEQLEQVLASKQGSLDAHESHLDSLESLANEGERLVEDQSRKATAALEELEWMEEELGRLGAQLVEVTARLDEKTSMLREASVLEKQSADRVRELESQKRLLEELERHNEAALAESKRLGQIIVDLKRKKQVISFELEPALNETLEELERSKAFAASELSRERGKVGRLERTLEQLLAKDASRAPSVEKLDEHGDGLMCQLERERAASARRTLALADCEKMGRLRRWRPACRIVAIH